MSFTTNLSKAYQVHRRKFLAGGALTSPSPLHFHLLSPSLPSSPPPQPFHHRTSPLTTPLLSHLQPSLTSPISPQTALAALQYTNLNPISRLFRTPGVENIENRFSSGGGTKSHIPGASTRRGDSENVESRAAKDQGIGSDKFREKVGEQKPDPSGFDKAWNKMNYGKDKGK